VGFWKMPDKMYVVCYWRTILKLNTRNFLRCRLLNKIGGMKPTRELYLRRRPQTEARKCPTGPTPGKDNAATPDAPRYTP